MSTTIPYCPILHPTVNQFNNFYQYVHMLDKQYKPHFGMVKIIPPEGWKFRKEDYENRLQNLEVKNPIEQNAMGSGNYIESKYIIQPKRTFREYREYALKEDERVKNFTMDKKRKLFWQSIKYSPPIYGSDLIQSLMDEEAGEWQFTKLNSILKHSFSNEAKGVNRPYCYVGCWKTFFSWHKEDMDLSAINYLHEGHPKVWYTIASDDGKYLEEEARKNFSQLYSRCKQFMRHKTILIKPQHLFKKWSKLKITTAEQNPNQIMIIFGAAYHCGFNSGFNIAEAVNYATIDWLDQLSKVEFCRCSKKSFRVNPQFILYNLEKSQIFNQIKNSKQFVVLKDKVHLERVKLQKKYGKVCSTSSYQKIEQQQTFHETLSSQSEEEKEKEEEEQQQQQNQTTSQLVSSKKLDLKYCPRQIEWICEQDHPAKSNKMLKQSRIVKEIDLYKQQKQKEDMKRKAFQQQIIVKRNKRNQKELMRRQNQYYSQKEQQRYQRQRLDHLTALDNIRNTESKKINCFYKSREKWLTQNSKDSVIKIIIQKKNKKNQIEIISLSKKIQINDK